MSNAVSAETEAFSFILTPPRRISYTKLNPKTRWNGIILHMIPPHEVFRINTASPNSPFKGYLLGSTPQFVEEAQFIVRLRRTYLGKVGTSTPVTLQWVTLTYDQRELHRVPVFFNTSSTRHVDISHVVTAQKRVAWTQYIHWRTQVPSAVSRLTSFLTSSIVIAFPLESVAPKRSTGKF